MKIGNFEIKFGEDFNRIMNMSKFMSFWSNIKKEKNRTIKIKVDDKIYEIESISVEQGE